MTIASEITRLQWAKADIATSIWNKWVTVPSATKLDWYSSLIDQIKTIEDTPIEVTWSQVYWGLFTIWDYQYMRWIDGCVSYATDNLVLIWYMGTWQTYDHYDQKDCHFIRWKKWVSSRKDTERSMWTGATYSFYNNGLYLTKESDNSYLFTANAYYDTDGATDWYYVTQIRYTVDTDTFTIVQSWTGTERPTQNDMNLYNATFEKSDNARTALFNLRNI